MGLSDVSSCISWIAQDREGEIGNKGETLIKFRLSQRTSEIVYLYRIQSGSSKPPEWSKWQANYEPGRIPYYSGTTTKPVLSESFSSLKRRALELSSRL